MEFEKCVKESFAVIGKEGSTLDGKNFIQKLWLDANSHFNEIEHLAKKDEKGNVVGVWGAMSDLSHSFKPWENNFTKGAYLAGIECNSDAESPVGFTKWIIPGFEYMCVKSSGLETFPTVIKYMKENNIPLVAAVHDFTNPVTKENFMYFPIRAS